MKAEREPGKTKWSVEDVDKLAALIATRVAPGGHEQADVSWSEIAKLMGNKTGKQCREKYRNDLRPGITKTAWCPEEDYVFALAHSQLGNKWHDVAQFLPQRAENTIKNRWNAVLRVWQRRTVKGYTLFENNLPSDFLSLYSTYAVHTPGPVAVERTKERWNELVELSEGQLPSLSSFEVPMDYFVDGPGATQLATLVQEDMAAAALRVPADLPLQSANIRAQLAAQMATDCPTESDMEKIREIARSCMQVSSPASGSRPRPPLNDPSSAPSPGSGDRPVSPAPVVKQGRSKQSQMAANAPSFHAALESVLNNHLRGSQGQGQGSAVANIPAFQDPFWDANTPPGPWESSLAFGTGFHLAEAATSGQTLSKKLSVDTQGRPASTSKGGSRSQRPGPLNSPQVRIKTLPSPAGPSGKAAGFSQDRDEDMTDDDDAAPPVDQRPHSSKAKHSYDSDPDYTPGSESHRSKRKLTDATGEGITASGSARHAQNHRDDPFRPSVVKRHRQDSVIKVEQEEDEGRGSRRQRVGVVGAEGDEPTPDDAAQLLMWLHENMPNKIKESPKDRKVKDAQPGTPARTQQRYRTLEQDSLVKGLEPVTAYHSVDHTRPHSATHSSDDADTEQMTVPPGGHYAPPLSQQVDSITQQYSAWVTQQAKANAAVTEGRVQWAMTPQAHSLTERVVPAEQLQWPLPPQPPAKQRGAPGGQPQWTGPVQPQQLLAPSGQRQRQPQPETPWEGVHGAQLSWGGKLPTLGTRAGPPAQWTGPVMQSMAEDHGAGQPQWVAASMQQQQDESGGYGARPPWAGQTPVAACPQVKTEAHAAPEGQWQWVASGQSQPEAQQDYEGYTVQPQWAGPNQPPYAGPPQPMQPPPEDREGRKGQPQRASHGRPKPAAPAAQSQWAGQSQPPPAAQQPRPGKLSPRQGEYRMPPAQPQWAGPPEGMASYGGQPPYAAPMQPAAEEHAPQGHWAWEPQANMPPPHPMASMPPTTHQPHAMRPSTPQQQPQVVYVIPAMVNGVPQLPPGMWIPPANTNGQQGSQQGWTMYMG